MTLYNLTGIAENTTGILTLTQGVNNVLMGGWLGTLFLIGISVVLFGSFMYSTNDTKKSVAATSFLCFGIAFMLRIISLISDTVLFIVFIAAAAAIAFTWRE